MCGVHTILLKPPLFLDFATRTYCYSFRLIYNFPSRAVISYFAYTQFLFLPNTYIFLYNSRYCQYQKTLYKKKNSLRAHTHTFFSLVKFYELSLWKQKAQKFLPPLLSRWCWRAYWNSSGVGADKVLLDAFWSNGVHTRKIIPTHTQELKSYTYKASFRVCIFAGTIYVPLIYRGFSVSDIYVGWPLWRVHYAGKHTGVALQRSPAYYFPPVRYIPLYILPPPPHRVR